jgi:hypothetical protein
MGWYILQITAFLAGAWSSVLWYEPGGPATAKQAGLLAAAIGGAAAWGLTISAARLVDYVKRRKARASHEGLIASNAASEARKGVPRLDRQP